MLFCHFLGILSVKELFKASIFNAIFAHFPLNHSTRDTQLCRFTYCVCCQRSRNGFLVCTSITGFCTWENYQTL